jgi:hypothetical protein
MTMKITLKELNAIKGSMAKLLVAQGIPSRVCHRAIAFTKKMTSEIEALEEVRLKLVKQYSAPAVEGVPTHVSDENLDAFTADFNEVLKEEVEIPDIKIALADLDKVGLTMQDYAALEFLIDDSIK